MHSYNTRRAQKDTVDLCVPTHKDSTKTTERRLISARKTSWLSMHELRHACPGILGPGLATLAPHALAAWRNLCAHPMKLNL